MTEDRAVLGQQCHKKILQLTTAILPTVLQIQLSNARACNVSRMFHYFIMVHMRTLIMAHYFLQVPPRTGLNS